MDAADVRGEVEALYAEARLFSTALPAGALNLACGIFGFERVRWVAGLESAARLVRLTERVAANDTRALFELHLREGLGPLAVQWVVAHELGEYRIERGGWSAQVLSWREQAANAIAAGVLAPDEAIQTVLRMKGAGPERVDLAWLAMVFQLSETIMLLRLGEAKDWPVALVNLEPLLFREPLVRRRGDWERGIVDHELVRVASASRGTHGYRRVRLRDAPHLVAVFRVG